MSENPNKPRPQHAVLLTQEQKDDWFQKRLQERLSVKPFESPEEVRAYLRTIRKQFNEIYGRDVPGSFIRRLAEKCGLPVDLPERTKIKIAFGFDLMDENQNYRINKTDFIKAMEKQFGEKTLGYIIDDIWDGWHGRDDHPVATQNIDTHGQQALFDE